jgi:two-component sensor histidine kinase
MSWISRYLNIGVDPNDDYFDQRLKRAINILSLNAFVMITFAGFYGWIIQENNTSPFILFSLPVFILVVYFNAIGKSLTAISILFMSSAVLLVFFSLRTGEEAYTHIHFTLNVIGVALLYRKEKVRAFLYLNLIFTIATIVFLFISFDNGWFDFLIDPQVEPLSQRKLNAVFLLIGAFIFSLVVIKSHAEQNRILSSSLAQQKILLAEVNHRVKNNMAVIISLINMKKNGTTNHDTISTLTEIQDQVMSMALVHRKIYEEKNKDAVDLKSFIDELAAGIGNSFPRETKVSIVTKIQDVQIDVSKAIPFGLILNELITNSMKHAFAGIHNPLIEIDLKNDNFDSIIISFRDNGVGISPNKIDNEEKLGIMLIKSLVEQLDGQSSFKNESGFVFEMVIPR